MLGTATARPASCAGCKVSWQAIRPSGHENLSHRACRVGPRSFRAGRGLHERSLTYNTTWKRPETRSFARLSSREKGLSFANSSGRYYGLAITGIKASTGNGRHEADADQDWTRARQGSRVAHHRREPGTRQAYRLWKFTDLAAAGRPARRGNWCDGLWPMGRSWSLSRKSASMKLACTVAFPRPTEPCRDATAP